MANIQSNRWQISRRQTLKGLGATMALPFLEAMRPLHGQSTSSDDPVRMACLFMPNGVRPDKWTPTGSGKTYKLSPILSPLEELKEEIMVISGLTNKASHGGDGHYFKTASWLTCTTIEKTVGSNVSSNGISIDQVAAQEIGNSTRLPSMELGTEPITSGIDRNVNLTRLYGSHISWKKPDVPLPCEINPRIAFDRLFRNRNKSGSSAAGNPDKSILDIVLDDANSLKRSLGTKTPTSSTSISRACARSNVALKTRPPNSAPDKTSRPKRSSNWPLSANASIKQAAEARTTSGRCNASTQPNTFAS